MSDLDKTQSVLDYGCGKGSDVKFLKNEGYDADGYDPYYNPSEPTRVYDVAMCSYVLNVISHEDRVEVVGRLSQMCNIVYIAVRNGQDFEQSWQPHEDGFITGRGTFQAGLSVEYLRDILDSQFKVVYTRVKGGNTFVKAERKRHE